MSGLIRRRPVTTWLMSHLRQEIAVHVELMSAEDHDGIKTMGWQDDPSKPGASFEPYAIVVPQSANKDWGAIGHNTTEWSFPYLFTVFGTSIDQVEDVADDIRQVSTPFRPGNRPRLMMGEVEWSIARLDCMAIGGVGWNNQISPAMYSQTDSYTVTIGRS